METRFQPLESDSCILKNVIYLAIYVDDEMMVGSDQEVLKGQLRKLKKDFKLTSNPLNRFLIESST